MTISPPNLPFPTPDRPTGWPVRAQDRLTDEEIAARPNLTPPRTLLRVLRPSWRLLMPLAGLALTVWASVVTVQRVGLLAALALLGSALLGGGVSRWAGRADARRA